MSQQVLPQPDQTLMYQEAAQAPQVIAQQHARNAEVVAALAADLRANPPPFAVTCARGSSDHAATYAKYLFETELGVVTASASPSVSSVYRADLRMRNALFIAVSQSGRSPDLLQTTEAARQAGARVVALVNVEDAPLAALADVVLPLGAGAERSVAATKSYLATLAAILQLTAHWKHDARMCADLVALPQALEQAWRADWSPLVEGLVDAQDLFVLGRGPGLAAAQEAALKFKETSGLHAEAFSTAEVKHGPMALIGPRLPVLCFSQADASQAGTLAMVDEFRGRGGRVWLAREQSQQPDDLLLADAAHPLWSPLLAIQSFYRAVNALALRRGHNPDLPPHLNKVTETT